MTVTLSFPADTEAILRERASRAGQSVESYLQQLIEKEVRGANGSPPPSTATPHARMTFDEILAPVRQGFKDAAATEEELTQLFEEAREEVH
jgi:hypothetical protein